MKTTWLIENTNTRKVHNYYETLASAKVDLKNISRPEYRILCIRGPYYGEGYHDYEFRFINKRFKKTVL